MPAELSLLPQTLRRESAVAQVVGRSSATICVAGPAQAFVIAGLAALTERRPLLAVTATDADADRLALDLDCFVSRELDRSQGSL